MNNQTKIVFLLSAALLLPAWAQAQKTPKAAGKALQKAASGASKQARRVSAGEAIRRAANARELLIPNPEWNATKPMEGAVPAKGTPYAHSPSRPGTDLQIPVRQWEPVSFPQRPLTPLEEKELSDQLELLGELRRALEKDPAIIVKPKFAKQMESINKLGIKMPEVSPVPANASLQDKRAFVQDLQNRVETAINEAETSISARLGHAPSKLNFQQIVSASRKDLLQARGRHEQKWEVFLQAVENKQPAFSWGTPGMDLIEIQPLQNTVQQTAVLANTASMIRELAYANPETLGGMLDIILYSSNANRFQKMELMQHVGGISELVGYNFVREYLHAFKRLPAVKNVSVNEYTDYHLLDKYARAKQASLLEEKNTAVPMPQEDAKAFLLLSSLIDYETSRASVLALAHGEKDAALWLLRHSAKNAKSREIIKYLNFAYAPKEKNILISNIVRTPVAKPEIPAYNKETQKNALEMRLDLLAHRIEMTSAEIDNLTNRVNNLSRHIEDAKKTGGAAFSANNTEMQLIYFRTERAKLDLRVTRLKDLSKKLRVELKEVYADLQDLLR